MGRASESRHIFFRWRGGICLEVPARLGGGHASISPRLEFAELLAAIRGDFRDSRLDARKPAVRRSDVIFGAAFYLAWPCDDREAFTRCRRTNVAGRTVFRAYSELGVFSGAKSQAIRQGNTIRRRRSVARSEFSRTMDSTNASGQRTRQHRSDSFNWFRIYIVRHTRCGAIRLGAVCWFAVLSRFVRRLDA